MSILSKVISTLWPQEHRRHKSSTAGTAAYCRLYTRYRLPGGGRWGRNAWQVQRASASEAYFGIFQFFVNCCKFSFFICIFYFHRDLQLFAIKVSSMLIYAPWTRVPERGRSGGVGLPPSPLLQHSRNLSDTAVDLSVCVCFYDMGREDIL